MKGQRLSAARSVTWYLSFCVYVCVRTRAWVLSNSPIYLILFLAIKNTWSVKKAGAQSQRLTSHTSHPISDWYQTVSWPTHQVSFKRTIHSPSRGSLSFSSSSSSSSYLWLPCLCLLLSPPVSSASVSAMLVQPGVSLPYSPPSSQGTTGEGEGNYRAI